MAAAAEQAASGAKPTQLQSTAVVAAHDKDINALAVSPNDALICTASQDRTAKASTLMYRPLVIKLWRGVWSVQFSPIDQCVLTGSGDTSVRLWALTDGSCLKTFEGHSASVLRASFITYGTQQAEAEQAALVAQVALSDVTQPGRCDAQVLSAGADGLVKLWGVRTSECLATFDEHEAKVWAMHVAGANDSLLVTGGADARVNVWRDCTTEDEAAAAFERSEAALKGQELANALQVRKPLCKTSSSLWWDDSWSGMAVKYARMLQGNPGRPCEGPLAREAQAVPGICAGLEHQLQALPCSSGYAAGHYIRAHPRGAVATLASTFCNEGFKETPDMLCGLGILKLCRQNNQSSKQAYVQQKGRASVHEQHGMSPVMSAGVGAVLDALSAYTERHLARMDRLRRSVSLLDYTLGCMHVIEETSLEAQAGRRSDEEDMDLEQIDIRALERVSPRTTLMAPEQSGKDADSLIPSMAKAWFAFHLAKGRGTTDYTAKTYSSTPVLSACPVDTYSATETQLMRRNGDIEHVRRSRRAKAQDYFFSSEERAAGDGDTDAASNSSEGNAAAGDATGRDTQSAAASEPKADGATGGKRPRTGSLSTKAPKKPTKAAVKQKKRRTKLEVAADAMPRPGTMDTPGSAKNGSRTKRIKKPLQ
ncbi:MAG: hypothetical protein MMC33_004284 [Icmadophila ericetorum]|nr:hypothetical protein [Icmadophila ericetorum]